MQVHVPLIDYNQDNVDHKHTYIFLINSALLGHAHNIFWCGERDMFVTMVMSLI